MAKAKFILCNLGVNCAHIHIQLDEGDPYEDASIRIVSLSDEDYVNLTVLIAQTDDPRAVA